MDRILLNDGNKIPAIGFGVFMIENNGPAYEAVMKALAAGYPHIDTAAAYFNEEDVGRAVRDSGLPRSEVFITSKLWLSDHGYEGAKRGLARSLKKLGTDYIDLYLIHQPYGDVAGAWRALEEAKAAGLIRSIGVSNMTPTLYKELTASFSVKPAVDQVESNPLFQQRPLCLVARRRSEAGSLVSSRSRRCESPPASPHHGTGEKIRQERCADHPSF